MAYCKRCACGHINKYERMGGAPLRCTKCSRFIAAVTEEIYREQEETPVREEKTSVREEEQVREDSRPEEKGGKDEFTGEQPPVVPAKGFAITLESPDGSFVLPVNGPITVGRNAKGMEYLGVYGDVSREHFTIAPRANGISATLTDISSMGTYVNGVRMMKGTSVAVSNYTELRLASRAFLLVRVKEVNGNA